MTYFFHTLTNVPVNEGTLGVEQVELVVYRYQSVFIIMVWGRGNTYQVVTKHWK